VLLIDGVWGNDLVRRGGDDKRGQIYSTNQPGKIGMAKLPVHDHNRGNLISGFSHLALTHPHPPGPFHITSRFHPYFPEKKERHRTQRPRVPTIFPYPRHINRPRRPSENRHNPIRLAAPISTSSSAPHSPVRPKAPPSRSHRRTFWPHPVAPSPQTPRTPSSNVLCLSATFSLPWHQIALWSCFPLTRCAATLAQEPNSPPGHSDTGRPALSYAYLSRHLDNPTSPTLTSATPATFLLNHRNLSNPQL